MVKGGVETHAVPAAWSFIVVVVDVSGHMGDASMGIDRRGGADRRAGIQTRHAQSRLHIAAEANAEQKSQTGNEVPLTVSLTTRWDVVSFFQGHLRA